MCPDVTERGSYHPHSSSGFPPGLCGVAYVCHHKLDLCWPGPGELILGFFNFEESDFHCSRFAPIIDPMYEDTVHIVDTVFEAPEGHLAVFESDKYTDR